MTAFLGSENDPVRGGPGRFELHREGRGLRGSRRHDWLVTGSSFFFFSLPGMNGLHGWARIGALVDQTISNWPFSVTSPT
ncbi:MAG: hypothetical protein R3E83_11980 [Burkholderiaceae bacterium]